MDEVVKYHVENLRLVIEATNRGRQALAQRQEPERQAEIARSEEHQKSVDEIAQRLKFDQ